MRHERRADSVGICVKEVGAAGRRAVSAGACGAHQYSGADSTTIAARIREDLRAIHGNELVEDVRRSEMNRPGRPPLDPSDTSRASGSTSPGRFGPLNARVSPERIDENPNPSPAVRTYSILPSLSQLR